MLSLFHFLCSFLPLLAQSIPAHSDNLVERDAKQVELSAARLSTSDQSNHVLVRPHIVSSSDTSENLQDEDRVSKPPLTMAYYPSWAAETYPPEKIPFQKLDWIDFAFAVPTETFNMSWDSGGSSSLLHRLVTAAHAHNTKVKASIGGWGGSEFFSSAVATPESRQEFASNILNVCQDYNLDGVDLDWEYPGRQGAGKNVVRPEDSANFLSFLQLLRKILPRVARISVAATQTAFADIDGQPMKRLEPFVPLLDWILLMNYDAWGSSSEPGPNAPLSDGCHISSQPDSNAVAAVNNWVSAGFPREKLVLGVPAYGYMSTSSASHLRQRRRSRTVLSRSMDSQRHVSPSPASKVVNGDGVSEGQVNFRQLVDQGALTRVSPANTDEPASFTAAGSFERFWDQCSSTPFLRSLGAGQVITYDDPVSLREKALFSSKIGMLGVSIFDITGDTDNSDLLNAVIRALGRKA